MDCPDCKPDGTLCPTHAAADAQAEAEIQSFLEDLPDAAETGPMVFGDDWPGVFLRGEHALQFASTLEGVLSSRHAPSALGVVDRAVLDGLVKTLRSCLVNGHMPEGLQRLKPYGECMTDAAQCPGCKEWFATGRIGYHVCETPEVSP